MKFEDNHEQTTVQCTWPEGSCKYAEAKAGKPDLYGRVWMHCEEGLSMTKASASRLMMFCLANRVEFGSLYAFDPTYRGSLVVAAVRLRPDQFASFEAETGGKLREPPKIKLNSADDPAQHERTAL